MADPVISSKESLTITISSGNTTGTVDTAAAKTLAQTIVILSAKGGTAKADESSVRVDWTDTDTLTASRQDGAAGTVVLELQVIEFNTEVTVQQETATHAGSATDTITAVTLAESSILGMGFEKSGTNFTTDDVFRVIFDSTTQISYRSQSVNSGQVCNVQVIDWGTTATTQELVYTLNPNTDTQQETTITTLTDLTHSFCMSTFDHTNNVAGFDDMAWTTKILSTTQVQNELMSTVNKDSNFVTYVVEFDASVVNVQRGEISTFNGSGNETQTDTITAVAAQADSCVFMGGAFHGNSWGRTNRATDEADISLIAFDGFNSDTVISFTRSATANYNTYLPWEVVEWTGTAGGGDINLGSTTGDETVSATLAGVTISLAAQTSGETASATLSVPGISLTAQTATETESATLGALGIDLDQTAVETASATLGSIEIDLAAQTATESASTALSVDVSPVAQTATESATATFLGVDISLGAQAAVESTSASVTEEISGANITFGPDTATETVSATLVGVTINLAAQVATETESATLDPVEFDLAAQTADEAASATLSVPGVSLATQTATEAASVIWGGETISGSGITLDPKTGTETASVVFGGVTISLVSMTADESASVTLAPVDLGLSHTATQAASAALGPVKLDLGNTVASETATASEVVCFVCDEYDEANQDAGYLVGTTFSGSTVRDGVGQSFTGNGGELFRAGFYLTDNDNTPVSATVSCKLWSHSGSYGFSSVGGSVLATADTTYTESTLPTGDGMVYFEFPGGTTLVDGTKYCISVEVDNWGSTAFDYVFVAYLDTSSPGHSGNYMADDGAAGWSANTTIDMPFEVLTLPPAPSGVTVDPKASTESVSASLLGVKIDLASQAAVETASADLLGVKITLASQTASESGSATVSPPTIGLDLTASEPTSAVLGPVKFDLGVTVVSETATGTVSVDYTTNRVIADTGFETATATLGVVEITLGLLTASETASAAEPTVEYSGTPSGNVTIGPETATETVRAALNDVKIGFVADEYDETNYDNTVMLGYDGSGGARDSVGQSFTGDGEELYRVQFWVQGNGTGSPPSATLTCKVYEHSGVFGTSSLPGALVATADTTYTESDLGTSALDWLVFEFPGGTTLTSGTNYCISLETSAFSSDPADYVAYVAYDSSSPSHPGNYFVDTPSVGSVAYNSVRTTVGGAKSDLQGATISGDVYIEFEINGSGATAPILFYLDGVLSQTENNPPYDFRGGAAPNPNPWDTTEVVDGAHTIEAHHTSGSGVVSSAFTVDNTAPPPDPDPDPDPPGGTVETINLDGGLTVSFDANVTSGQYLNGEYWVVGPVGITGHNGTGAEVDPVFGPSFGFDSRRWYNASKHFTSGNLTATKSLFITYERNGTINTTTGVPRPYLARGAVVTVVAAPPPTDSFRPLYAGAPKVTYTLPPDFDARIAALPKFAFAPENVPGKITKYTHTAGPSLLASWEQRYFQFGDWHEDYSRDLASDYGKAACHLLLDIPDSQKRDLAIALIQHGIDYHGCWQSAILEGYEEQTSLGRQMFSHGGGIGAGRKMPIILAGHLLGDDSLRDFYKNATWGNKNRWFLEDCQTWINDGVTGDQAYYTSAGTPAGHVAWREGYRSIHTPGNTSYRVCCTANGWAPQMLVMKALGLELAWDHDEWFDWVDWYVDVDAVGNTFNRVWDSWCRSLWDAYRPTL